MDPRTIKAGARLFRAHWDEREKIPVVAEFLVEEIEHDPDDELAAEFGAGLQDLGPILWLAPTFPRECLSASANPVRSSWIGLRFQRIEDGRESLGYTEAEAFESLQAALASDANDLRRHLADLHHRIEATARAAQAVRNNENKGDSE